MAEPYFSFPATTDIAAIVLAGGLSTRLGRDKAFLNIGDTTLLERAITRVEALFRRILVVTSQRGRDLVKENGLNFGREVSLITDLYPGKGSLGGIYSGLAVSPSFYNLVIACDMPFVNTSLVEYMVRQILGFDVIIPRFGGVLEPLHCIYSKNCLTSMKRLLDEDHLKIIDLFPKLNVRYIEEAEINRFDPHHLSFFNVNTAADFEKARQLEQSLLAGN